MKPTVNRMVHYVAFGTPGGEFPSVCRSAVITEVGGWVADPTGGSEVFGWISDTIRRTIGDDPAVPTPLDGPVWSISGRRVRLQTWKEDACSLTVLNPTGLFLQVCEYHDGAGQTGDPNCPNVHQHGDPFRYCSCGWTEPSHKGGTWHWPEREEVAR